MGYDKNNPWMNIEANNTWNKQAGGVRLGDFSGVDIKGVDIPKPSKNPWIGNVVGGAIEGIGAGANIFNDIRSEVDRYRDAKFNQADTEINGVPNYSGVSNLNQQAQDINPDDAGDGLVLNSAIKGLNAGKSFGFIGAGVGAVGGAIAGLFGKKKAKEEAELAQGRAQDAFQTSQDNYNEDVGDYYQGVDAQRQDTQGDRNYAKRIYGVNQYNDPFQSLLG